MEWLHIENVVSYGIFAALFVWLLHTTNKRNEAREKKYQDTIEKNQEVLTEQAKAFTSIASDVKEIKYDLRKEREKK